MLHDRATHWLKGLDPERAHRLGILGLKAGLGPRQRGAGIQCASGFEIGAGEGVCRRSFASRAL